MLPLATIIILAGLSSIPQGIHDAAAIDGAGFWFHLFQITLPLVAPVGVVALLFGIVFTFTDLIVVFVPDARRPLRHDAGIDELGLFYRHSRRRSCWRRRDLAVPAAGPGGGVDPVPAVCPPRGDRLMKNTSARIRTVARRGGHTAILVFFVTFLAFPFYWMLITTFKTTNDLYNTAFNPYLFHDAPTLHHLQVLFGDTQYLQWLANTAFVGVLVVAVTLVLAVPAGYVLSRMTGSAAQNLGIAIFLTYLVPPTILFIPFARIISDLGLQNSLWSLISSIRASQCRFAPGC